MYQPFHKLRVRFAKLEMKQGEVARRANMAESTLTARMTGRLPWKGDEIAAVAKVLNIPTDQIGTFFFEDAPRKKKGVLQIKVNRFFRKNRKKYSAGSRVKKGIANRTPSKNGGSQMT